ncbi:hypothetical protein GCM10027074_49540 [Streptomyces deserti]
MGAAARSGNRSSHTHQVRYALRHPQRVPAHVGRILAPGRFLDFTFDRTEGEEHHVLREDFYYRTQTLVELAEKHGLSSRFTDDWEELPHRQSKMRVTAMSEPAPTVGS